ARDLPDHGTLRRVDRVAMARDAALLHDEADQPAFDALGMLAGEGLTPDESASAELDHPAETGLARRGRLVDVVAVQAQPRLQAQRVARAEATRFGAGARQRFEDRAGVGRLAEDLEAVLAGVAGARRQHRATDQLARRDVKRSNRAQLR